MYIQDSFLGDVTSMTGGTILAVILNSHICHCSLRCGLWHNIISGTCVVLSKWQNITDNCNHSSHFNEEVYFSTHVRMLIMDLLLRM